MRPLPATKVRPVPYQGNPLFPLPPDYESLTTEGQRQARVNACRQWFSGPDAGPEAAERAVAAFNFFDAWYLTPDKQGDFDPQFYDSPPSRNALFHDDICRALTLKRQVIVAAPRGFAKSVHARKLILLQMVSRPRYSVTYVTSRTTLAHRCGTSLMTQLRYNQRLNDDFGPECVNGRLVPYKGVLPFSAGNINLGNFSSFFGTSVESRNRGDRPLFLVLDDPEYDPTGALTLDSLVSGMENFVFKILVPMLRPHSRALWLGTVISPRHFLCRAFSDATDNSELMDRFKSWFRMMVRAEIVDPSGNRVSTWPEAWPLEALDEKKRQMGTVHYLAEYMNMPEAGEGLFFRIDETGNSWTSESVITQGLSEEQVVWTRDGNRTTMLKRDFLRQCPLFMTIDSSYTNTPTSDYKAAVVMAITPRNELFVLDCWAARCMEVILLENVLRMARTWRCPRLFVETVRESFGVYNALRHILLTNVGGITEAVPGIGVYPVPSHRTSKVSLIAGLRFRFDNGLIKLPLHKRMDRYWMDMFRQIDGFRPTLKDGGLSNDDLIDCVAMSQLVLPGLPSEGQPGAQRQAPDADEPIEDRILRGETHDSLGLPLVEYITFHSKPSATIDRLLEVFSKRRKKEQESAASLPRTF